MNDNERQQLLIAGRKSVSIEFFLKKNKIK